MMKRTLLLVVLYISFMGSAQAQTTQVSEESAKQKISSLEKLQDKLILLEDIALIQERLDYYKAIEQENWTEVQAIKSRNGIESMRSSFSFAPIQLISEEINGQQIIKLK